MLFGGYELGLDACLVHHLLLLQHLLLNKTENYYLYFPHTPRD